MKDFASTQVYQTHVQQPSNIHLLGDDFCSVKLDLAKSLGQLHKKEELLTAFSCYESCGLLSDVLDGDEDPPEDIALLGPASFYLKPGGMASKHLEVLRSSPQNFSRLEEYFFYRFAHTRVSRRKNDMSIV